MNQSKLSSRPKNIFANKLGNVAISAAKPAKMEHPLYYLVGKDGEPEGVVGRKASP